MSVPGTDQPQKEPDETPRVLRSPLRRKGRLQVGWGRDAGGHDWSTDLWEGSHVKRPPLSIDFRVVLALYSSGQVVGIGHAVSDLFQLVQADFSTFIDPLDDRPRHFIGQVALPSARPEPALMEVILLEFSGPGNAFPGHIGSCILPHGIKPSPICVCCGLG